MDFDYPVSLFILMMKLGGDGEYEMLIDLRMMIKMNTLMVPMINEIFPTYYNINHFEEKFCNKI
jgi:hypothetical protein